MDNEDMDLSLGKVLDDLQDPDKETVVFEQKPKLVSTIAPDAPEDEAEKLWDTLSEDQQTAWGIINAAVSDRTKMEHNRLFHLSGDAGTGKS